MLLGVVLVVLAAVALVAGSALLGDGLAGLSGSLPARQVRAVVIALSGALATTVVAVARNQTAMGSGVPFGAAMFVVASGFGAGALLGRRRMVVDDPILYAAPAAGVVLAALSVSSDRAFSRGAGVLLAIVFVPYLLWVLLEPVRTHAAVPDELARDEAREHALDEGTSATDVRAGVSEEPTAGGTADVPVGKTAEVRVGKTADVRVERPAGGRPSSGRAVAGGRALGGAVLVVGAAFALVEGTVRVGVRAHLAPGFAGAALAGSLVALPFALLVVFPRSTRQDDDPGTATMTAVAGLMTLVPGVAAVVRPFELDGAAAACLLGAALLYAVAAAWMLLRGRSDRVLGAVTLLVYAACLVVAGSL